MDASDSGESSSALLLSENEIMPKEETRSLEASFYIIGMGVLLPWNVILSSFDYFVAQYPDDPPLQVISNAYTFSFMISGVTFMFTPTKHRNMAVLSSFTVLTLVSLFFPFVSERGVFSVAFLVALFGIANGLCQGTLYGIVSLFPGGQVTTAFNAGGGLAAILIVALRAFSRLLSDDGDMTIDSLRNGFRIFCTLCTLLNAACVVVFYRLYKSNQTYKHCLLNEEERDVSTSDVFSCLRDISIPALSIFISFVTTLMLFPGIMGRLPKRISGIPDKFISWYPLAIVIMFALGDMAGRVILSSTVANRYPSSLWPLVIFKCCATLVFLFVWTGAIHSTACSALSITFIHAFLNGFIMNIAFIVAPNYTSSDTMEIAGRVMFIMLIGGLFGGTSSGWALEWSMKRIGWL